jgi:hypothetical protein
LAGVDDHAVSRHTHARGQQKALLMTLRILSNNILAGGENRLPLIASVIQQQQPDIVALQESRSRSNAEALAHQLDMSFTMKAAIWNQAFVGRTSVSCPIGRVVGIRRRKGQLQAMIFGWGRWYPVEDVLIVAGAPPILAQPVC